MIVNPKELLSTWEGSSFGDDVKLLWKLVLILSIDSIPKAVGRCAVFLPIDFR